MLFLLSPDRFVRKIRISNIRWLKMFSKLHSKYQDPRVYNRNMQHKFLGSHSRMNCIKEYRKAPFTHVRPGGAGRG